MFFLIPCAISAIAAATTVTTSSIVAGAATVLLENGDAEALIAKITEAKDLISQPVDEEIKNRLSDCKLKKCN